MATTTQPRPPGLHEGLEVESLPDGLGEPPTDASEETLAAALVEARPRSVAEVVRELPEVLELARHAEGPERAVRARQLNQYLEALASEGGSREAADVLLRLLEGEQLEYLVERRGRTCRSVAVETLLRLGFPYALEVRPEDLEHLRDQVPRRKNWHLSLRTGAAGVLGLGLLGEWLVFSPGFVQSSEGLPMIAVMGMQLLGLVAGLVGSGNSDGRRAGLWLLAMLSLVQLLIGVPGGFEPALFGGVAGLVAWLLLWLPRR